jgi:hypothetical protein
MRDVEVAKLYRQAYSSSVNVLISLPPAFGVTWLLKDRPVALYRFSWFLTLTLVPYSLYNAMLLSFVRMRVDAQPHWQAHK